MQEVERIVCVCVCVQSRGEVKASRLQIRPHVSLACTCPPASGKPEHPRSQGSLGRGAPGAAAPRRAEGGAREGARDGKGERAASNAWNNSASVWKAAASVPPPPAAAAQLQLRVPPPWPHPHRSRPWSPSLLLPSRLRPARKMTRSWGNSEGRWPGGRKPRKVGTAEAAGAAGIREPGSGRPP